MRKKIAIPILLLMVILLAWFTISSIQSQQNTIKKTVETLSSQEFMGRLTGTEGNEKTIDYITHVFTKLNLEKYDDDYYHESKQTIYHPDQQQHHLEVMFEDGSSNVYKYGEDYLDYPMEKIDLQSSITLDIEDKDIKEKIIVIDKNDKFSISKSESKAVFRKVDTLFKISSMLKIKTPYIQITDKLYTDLKTKNVDYVKLNCLYVPNEIDAKSVIGKISGKDSTKAVVLSAHFDHVGWAGDTVFSGTVDNASGTSILLELAKDLKERSKKERFNIDIVIAAFNGEDSFLGCSEAFVKDITNQYDEFYNINIDCIGKSDGGTIVLNGEYEDSGINTTLKQALMTCFSNNAVDLLDESYGGSDHMAFNLHNIPGVTIGQKDVMGENNTTKIHTKEDNIDIIDFEQIEKVAEVIYDFIITNDGTIYKPSNDISKSTSLYWIMGTKYANHSLTCSFTHSLS